MMGKLKSHIGLAVVIAITWGAIEFLRPDFLSGSNLINLMRQAGPLALVALGQAIVIIARGLDLSVGSIMGLVSVLSGIVGVEWGLAAGLAAGALTGVACGAFNGLMVSVFSVPAFVATLGMLSIARGAALTITGGATMDVPDGFSSLAWSNIGPVPEMAVITVAFFVVLYGVLELTTYGRRIYATGSNPEATRLSGINVNWHRFSTFVLSGLLAAVGAILLSSRMNSGNAVIGVGYELESIAAAVIGGISLRGGEGSLLGVLLGVIFLVSLSNGLRLLGVSSYLTVLIEGVVFVIAVWLNLRIYTRRT
jgi:ribose/xylose/arabinose/galactoside ABC-type transport system permease subunit